MMHGVEFKTKYWGLDPKTFRGVLGPFLGVSGPGTTSIQFLVQFYTFLENLARISLAGEYSPHGVQGYRTPEDVFVNMLKKKTIEH